MTQHSIAQLKLMQQAVIREQANDGLLSLEIACAAAGLPYGREGAAAVESIRRSLQQQRDGN